VLTTGCGRFSDILASNVNAIAARARQDTHRCILFVARRLRQDHVRKRWRVSCIFLYSSSALKGLSPATWRDAAKLRLIFDETAKRRASMC